jgi:hypothetical protein
MNNPFKDLVQKIKEINQKYSKPRIKMSRNVRIVLLSLRIYLIFLILLLAYKFVTQVLH